MERKRQIKNQVKENGFYVNFVADHLTHTDATKKVSKIDDSSVMFDSKEEIPEGENIVILSGILSQNYPVGKKSRNGYKILQKGVDYSDYKHNNIVLLQHNDSLGGIGRARMIYLDKKGNSNIIMYVDLNTIKDDHIRYQIRNGYMKGVSTGHNLLEAMFEDVEDGGKLLTFDEAEEKYGFREVFFASFGSSDKLIYTVTKALMIENSVVTIGSNEKAILTHDTIGNFAIKNMVDEDRLKNILLTDKNGMKKEDLIKLIEDSVLTKKEQSELISMLDKLSDDDEKGMVAIKDQLETAEEEVVEETEEVVEETEEVAEEEVAEEDVVEGEVVEEETVTDSVENEEDTEEEVVEEETITDSVENEEEAEAEEEEVVEEETITDSVENKEDTEEEEVIEEEAEEEVEKDNKISNGVEKRTNEISSLKNELKSLSEIVDSLVKRNDELEKSNKELVDVVSTIADLSIKNSKNLSNIVTLGVSEVATKDSNATMSSLDKLKNLLSKEIK